MGNEGIIQGIFKDLKCLFWLLLIAQDAITINIHTAWENTVRCFRNKEKHIVLDQFGYFNTTVCTIEDMKPQILC